MSRSAVQTKQALSRTGILAYSVIIPQYEDYHRTPSRFCAHSQRKKQRKVCRRSCRLSRLLGIMICRRTASVWTEHIRTTYAFRDRSGGDGGHRKSSLTASALSYPCLSCLIMLLDKGPTRMIRSGGVLIKNEPGTAFISFWRWRGAAQHFAKGSRGLRSSRVALVPGGLFVLYLQRFRSTMRSAFKASGPGLAQGRSSNVRAPHSYLGGSTTMRHNSTRGSTARPLVLPQLVPVGGVFNANAPPLSRRD